MSEPFVRQSDQPVPLGELAVDPVTGEQYRGDGLTNGGIKLTDGVTPDTVANPVFDPDGSAGFIGEQVVSLTCATSGAQIRYLRNAGTPSEQSGVLYRGPFTIRGTETIQAIAFKPGLVSSAVVSKTFVNAPTIELAAPTGFAAMWSGPSLKVSLDLTSGVYAHDLHDTDYVVGGVTHHYYVDAAASDDTGTGLTVGSPKKSWDAMTALIGSQTGKVIHIHVLSPGTYTAAAKTTFTVPINITADGAAGTYLCLGAGVDGTTFALDTGDTYVKTGFVAAAIYDLGNRDETTGSPQKLTLAADLATCRSTAGTWFANASDTYVHLQDGTAPDGTIAVAKHTTGGVIEVRNAAYVKGLTFIGGANAFKQGSITSGAESSAMVFSECEFIGGSGTNDGCSFTRSAGFVWMDRCKCSHGPADNFNYNATGSSTLCVLETDCVSADSGTSSSNNATTLHNGIAAIRIGGRYYGGDRTVHDIGAGGSWNLGCACSGGRASWACGVSGQATKMWLDGSTASDASQFEIEMLNSVGTLYHHNLRTDITGWRVSGSTVSSYL